MTPEGSLSAYLVTIIDADDSFLDDLETLVLRHGGGHVSLYEFEDARLRTLKEHRNLTVGDPYAQRDE